MDIIQEQKQLVKTARVTGVWYLLMAISGILGFMVFHGDIFGHHPSNNPEKINQYKPI